MYKSSLDRCLGVVACTVNISGRANNIIIFIWREIIILWNRIVIVIDSTEILWIIFRGIEANNIGEEDDISDNHMINTIVDRDDEWFNLPAHWHSSQSSIEITEVEPISSPAPLVHLDRVSNMNEPSIGQPWDYIHGIDKAPYANIG